MKRQTKAQKESNRLKLMGHIAREYVARQPESVTRTTSRPILFGRGLKIGMRWVRMFGGAK